MDQAPQWFLLGLSPDPSFAQGWREAREVQQLQEEGVLAVSEVTAACPGTWVCVPRWGDWTTPAPGLKVESRAPTEFHLEFWWRQSTFWLGFLCWKVSYFSFLKSYKGCTPLESPWVSVRVQGSPPHSAWSKLVFGSLCDRTIDVQDKPSLFVWSCFLVCFWFYFSFTICRPGFTSLLLFFPLNPNFHLSSAILYFSQFYCDIIDM